MHAAMGLVNLNHIKSILESRKMQYEGYLTLLNQAKSKIQFQKIPTGVTYNYSYFPILLSSEEALLKLFNDLVKHDIFHAGILSIIEFLKFYEWVSWWYPDFKRYFIKGFMFTPFSWHD